MIRIAELSDVPEVLRMSKKFYASTSYHTYSGIPMCDETVEQLAKDLITAGTLSVAELDGKVVGMLAMVGIPFMFNKAHTHLGEVVWWVDEEARGTKLGIELLKEATNIGVDMGATHVQMATLASSPEGLDAVFAKDGYKLTERLFTKVI